MLAVQFAPRAADEACWSHAGACGETHYRMRHAGSKTYMMGMVDREFVNILCFAGFPWVSLGFLGLALACPWTPKP